MYCRGSNEDLRIARINNGKLHFCDENGDMAEDSTALCCYKDTSCYANCVMFGGRPEGKHFYCGPMRIARNWKGILQSKVDELKQKDEENARKDKELNRLSTLVGETQKEVYELRLKLSKVEKSKKVKG